MESTSTVNSYQPIYTTLPYDGEVTIEAAGTPKRLNYASIKSPFGIIVKARKGNTGYIKVGSSSPKLRLEPGESIHLNGADPYEIWVDAQTSGSIVEWLAFV